MKESAFDHPKFYKLRRLLGQPMFGVRGIMESVWILTAKHAPQGDFGRIDPEFVCAKLDWPFEEYGFLVRCLVEAGFLEQHAEHGVIVHDWAEHCCENVKKRVQRDRVRFLVGGQVGQSGQNGQVVQAGQSVPVRATSAADILRKKPGMAAIDRMALVSEIMVLSGDGDEYRGWWLEVAERAWKAGVYGDLDGFVRYAKDCADPVVRQRKDLGVLKRPGAWIAGELKGLGVALPAAPKQARVG